MNRREFVKTGIVSGIGFSTPFWHFFEKDETFQIHSEEFHQLIKSLLKEWCDGMLAVQVINPKDPKEHGLLKCPACETIHARCPDAVYPFLHMAKVTGDKKYLDAGIAVFEWSENVSLPDGSWSNGIDPKSWNGTTIFGAIALAEAIHLHGDLLDQERLQKWTNRLQLAVNFIYEKFNLSFTNINYGATAVYGLSLFSKVLKEERYLIKAKELASEIHTYFTKENLLLFGETKPSDKKSEKGLYGVDLGYNVEESLNSLVIYALEQQDEPLLDLLEKSLESHLEFMLSDGGWDNSWGTRQFKWTYWGSRTSDGCQPAFAMMAYRNPAFGTAAVRNTELLKKCTANGLLHGGIHYESHGIPPCVHHTFAHAKPLAFLLDHWEKIPKISTQSPLPRTVASGIRHFEDLDLSLFAKGDWRGTISGYDAIYRDGAFQATGGALGMLYHQKVGVILAASMAKYMMIEPYNQQPNPGEDFALTPRIESYRSGIWYSNIFDRSARLNEEESEEYVKVTASCLLKNESSEPISDSPFLISYTCSENQLVITAEAKNQLINPTSFVFPLISESSELIRQRNDFELELKKEKGTIVIHSKTPMQIKKTERNRVFNMVPGMEAIPVIIPFPMDQKKVEITLSVI